jgi:DNA-binding NtrC family response regulator
VTKGTRILIVEDDAHERQGLSELLAAWGYETQTAANGAEGLEKVSSFSPIVIISDLRMPGLTGMDLLKQLREARVASHFIMLTGQGTIEEAVEATKLGAFNFLEKPVDPKRLQVELRNCLERHEGERKLEAAHRNEKNLGKDCKPPVGRVAIPTARVGRPDWKLRENAEGLPAHHEICRQAPSRIDPG